MIEVQSRKFLYRKKCVWFADKPFDIDNCDAAFFYAVKNSHNIPGFTCATSNTLLIDLSPSEDDIKKAMSKNCRYEVNRAMREGLAIRKNKHQQEFYELYTQFVKAKRFDGDLDRYWDLAAAGNLYTCHYRGQLIAGLLTLQDDMQARWLLSGSLRLSVDDKQMTMISGLANRLLVWEALLDAKQQGIQLFDLGGYYNGDDQSNPEYRIARFKKGFGGKPTEQFKYSKYYSPSLRFIKRLKKLKCQQ
ncbi:peptidoglycan bridge formation glycyltransferase FemA/FemB family protein [Pontibacterium granulatum]|uniref:peptidoglycan bridge formation glycyltransferase FemA/FemB family protein n=1 Tax=Pontibacterium granulatum TaxID=2036029 RepID=UPI00249C2CD1|nr:peptidoglycan bridge formation glycyltransferase FemA/FemB family protein [Pontibacterium granulatum]MDI3325736.1 peptidoglycan bridge formation glycyltransferase FemA/FemB family protein [Pontibacterium granulatum]